MNKTPEQLRANFVKRHGHKPGEAPPKPVTPEQEAVVRAAIESRDRNKPAAAASVSEYAGKGYMELVEEYRDRRGGTLTDAMIAVNRKHPAARQDYIRRNNPHMFD